MNVVDKILKKMYRVRTFMRQYLLIVGMTCSVLLTIVSKPVFAADDCTIIYGGGEIKCEATQSADKKITATSTEPVVTNPPTTKGGLPVDTPPPATQTPGTGPEALGLLSLIPAAAAGIFLRRKTK